MPDPSLCSTSYYVRVSLLRLTPYQSKPLQVRMFLLLQGFLTTSDPLQCRAPHLSDFLPRQGLLTAPNFLPSATPYHVTPYHIKVSLPHLTPYYVRLLTAMTPHNTLPLTCQNPCCVRVTNCVRLLTMSGCSYHGQPLTKLDPLPCQTPYHVRVSLPCPTSYPSHASCDVLFFSSVFHRAGVWTQVLYAVLGGLPDHQDHRRGHGTGKCS